jgi:thermitase
MSSQYGKMTLLAAVGVCGVLGWATWYANSNLSLEGSTELSSKSKTKKNRETILTKASDVSSKTKQEEQVLLNDPAVHQNWGIRQSDAARAWSVSRGSKKIVVAVIDTGSDLQHEDLANNYWKNPGETGKDSKGRDKSTNGVDDDGNGFVDDVNGWNFVSNNNNLTDNHGHGTHIAGIIGAEAGNKKGVAGISPEVSLMVLKYYDPKVPNTDNLKNTVNAIRYAIKMKAHIINYSGGGTEYSQEEFEAVKEAQKEGILFVAAAGNERSNSDKHKYYPADYGLTNIISVTAIDPSTEVLASSNYGEETVDLAAPGQNILSTLPGSNYGTMTGTSQATAFVTGGAVLVMAHKDNISAEDTKKYILATGDSQMSLLAKCSTSKQLNLFKALTVLDSGVGVSGVVAANATDMKKFTIDSQGIEANRGISSFGKALLQNLETNQVLQKKN